MTNTYRIKIEAKCPADGSTDVYEATIVSGQTISCEDIMTLAKEISESNHREYQEYWTAYLAKRLNARVTLQGLHFGRVFVVSEA